MRRHVIWGLRRCLAGDHHFLPLPSFAATSLPSAARWGNYGSNFPRTYKTDPSQVLASLHAAEFQQYLDILRKEQGVLSWPKLLAEFRRGVPTATEADAQRVCNALITSGSLLRHGDIVFIRPSEIVDVLRHALPADLPTLRKRLAAAEAALQELETRYNDIRRYANYRSNLVNYAVFGYLVLQWAVLFRLTYWELSWDVMEPAGFFIGGLSSLVSVAYFLKTRKDFNYEVMHSRFMSDYEKKAFDKSGFNMADYRRRQLEVERLRASMRAAEEAQMYMTDELKAKAA
jgi:calcium uniporter protein, mitochondrial